MLFAAFVLSQVHLAGYPTVHEHRQEIREIIHDLHPPNDDSRACNASDGGTPT